MSQIPALPPAWRDFRNVLFATWKALGLPDPTRLQYGYAHELQHGGDRLIAQAYRGFGKTYIATAHALYRHRWRIEEVGPSVLATLIVSQGKAFADIISRFAFQVMNLVPEFRVLLPRGGQPASMDAFDVGPKKPAKDPSFRSLGVTGQMTGARADDIIADDVETPSTAGTVGQREKLLSLVSEFTDIVRPGGRILFLGTPQSEDTIYDKLADRGYRKVVFPARYPTPGALHLAPVLERDLIEDPTLSGQPTDPDRFDEHELTRREAEEGRSRFQVQFLLDPSAAAKEVHPLRLTDLVVMDLDPRLGPSEVVWGRDPELEHRDIPVFGLTGDRYYRPWRLGEKFLPWEHAILVVDPSGRGKDETAWAVLKLLNNTLFLADFGGFTEGFEDPTLRALAMVAKVQNVNAVLVEATFGDGMFTRLLLPHLRHAGVQAGVEEVKPGRQKELRICDTLEPVLNQHRLVVDAGALRRDAGPRPGLGDDRALLYRLAFQLSRMTRERGAVPHDDRLDVLAIGVAHYGQALARTAAEAQHARDEEDFDRAIQELDERWERSQGRRPHSGTLVDSFNPFPRRGRKR